MFLESMGYTSARFLQGDKHILSYQYEMRKYAKSLRNTENRGWHTDCSLGLYYTDLEFLTKIFPKIFPKNT